MSFHNDIDELENSFITTRELLEQLHARLQERRGAWISVRPDVVQPCSEIEQLSHRLVEQEQRRNELLRRIRQALPAPLGATNAQLHINVTRIAAALPRERGQRLRRAADAVTPLARAVRAETTLGQRLLSFAHRAQQEMHANIAGAVLDSGSPGYDSHARNVRQTRRTGQLVDGRI